MPRARKPKAIAPAEAPMAAPAEAPKPPAPAEEQDARAPLAVATGTNNENLQGVLLTDIIACLGVASTSPAHAGRGAAAIALMSAVGPRDALEGLLAGQVVALHAAGMMALRRAASASLPPEIGSRLRRDAATMFKTVNETVEIIEARRGNGGRQRITIEYVDKAVIGVPKEGA